MKALAIILFAFCLSSARADVMYTFTESTPQEGNFSLSFTTDDFLQGNYFIIPEFYYSVGYLTLTVSTRPHAWLQDLYLYTSTSNHGIYYDAIVRDYQYAPPGLGFVYGGGIAGASLTQLGQWSNGTDTLTITDPADVVDAPEPAAWALMALGGLLLGGSLLTQKRLRTRDGAKVEE